MKRSASSTNLQCDDGVKKLRQSDQKYTLSAKQRLALDAILEGHNVFLTGEAGSGKSFLIADAKRELEAQGKTVQICATTGIAAWNAGGATLHSWSGCGIGNQGDAEHYARQLKRNKRAEDWTTLDVLFIEECSMLDVAYFTLLDEVARKLRHSVYAFGGIQLVLVGDFLQCPPIPQRGQARQYVFECPLWEKLHCRYVQLDSNFRQQEDPQYRELLQRMKLGELTQQDRALLRTRVVAPDHDCSHMTRLRSTRVAVEKINNEEIAKLSGETHTYEAALLKYDNVQRATKEEITEEKERQAPVDRVLKLRVGTLVLLRCNLDVASGLFNGARGRVTSFKQQRSANPNTKAPYFPVVEFECGETLLITPHQWDTYIGRRRVQSFQQVPLTPRYAITIHKAQGLTLSEIQLDGHTFDAGQEYVAHSRVPSLKALHLTQLSQKSIPPDPQVLKFLRENGLIPM